MTVFFILNSWHFFFVLIKLLNKSIIVLLTKLRIILKVKIYLLNKYIYGWHNNNYKFNAIKQ